MRITECLSPGDFRFDAALCLAAKVFNEVEAPLYSQSGIEHFMSFLYSRELKDSFSSGNFKVYVCSEKCSVIGMAAVRNSSHISLAFVDGDHRGTGVGKEIFSRIFTDFPSTVFTVHAAPPAEGFYRSLGFLPTDVEKLEDGIIYIPMERKIP